MIVDPLNLLMSALAQATSATSPWWAILFGRLHLLILHFPIGLLVAALLVDVCRRRSLRPAPGDAVASMVALGALGAVIASAMGLVLAEVDGHHNSLIERHKVLGLIATGIAITAAAAAWWARRQPGALRDWTFRGLLLVGVGVLGVGADLGGQSVHGEEFLTEMLFSPAPASGPKSVVDPQPAVKPKPTTDPSAPKATLPPSTERVDFARDIRPLLEDTCIECHGEKKAKGKLRLDSRALALKGGKNGPAIVPGAGADSLLVQRVVGVEDEDVMPIKKDPLTAEQIALLTRWIDQGAVWDDEAPAVAPGH